MKKIYIAPNVKVTEMKVSHIICASNAILSTSDGDRITESEGFGSRSFDAWGDDEDGY